MAQINPEGESKAERAGIVDQQDAALEAMEHDDAAREAKEEAAAEKGPDVGPMADDPMEGDAPSG